MLRQIVVVFLVMIMVSTSRIEMKPRRFPKEVAAATSHLYRFSDPRQSLKEKQSIIVVIFGIGSISYSFKVVGPGKHFFSQFSHEFRRFLMRELRTKIFSPNNTIWRFDAYVFHLGIIGAVDTTPCRKVDSMRQIILSQEQRIKKLNEMVQTLKRQLEFCRAITTNAVNNTRTSVTELLNVVERQ